MEERRLRTDDQPQAPVFEAMNAVAFRRTLSSADHRLDGRPGKHDGPGCARLVRALVCTK